MNETKNEETQEQTPKPTQTEQTPQPKAEEKTVTITEKEMETIDKEITSLEEKQKAQIKADVTKELTQEQRIKELTDQLSLKEKEFGEEIQKLRTEFDTTKTKLEEQTKELDNVVEKKGIDKPFQQYHPTSIAPHPFHNQ